MAVLKPFRGVRPRPDLVDQIASPPYDVLNSDEARLAVEGKPLSFLHVVKPEVDLDPSVDVHSDDVYEKGAANLRKLVDDGSMLQDPAPCFYIYQQRMGDHVQAGIVGGASVEEYQGDLIKKHEHTRPDKELDRVKHVDTLGANTGPVFLTYESNGAVNGIVDRVRQEEPQVDFVADDGIGHTVWVVDDPATLAELEAAFAAMPCLYVADGHHRSAAASRVGTMRKERNPDHRGDEPYNYFLAVAFPDDQLKILDYNRVVKDLNGLGEEEFLEKVRESFEVTPTESPKPEEKANFGMYLGGRWYRLVAKPGTYPADDPVAGLDVAILQDNLLAPVLGIQDPRRDSRVDFVGGIRGLKELEKRCAEDAAVAFALFPTGIKELMAIADAGEVMPPKSTWFEPKLRSGIVVKMLEE